MTRAAPPRAAPVVGQRAQGRRPEWWLWAVAGVGWLVLWAGWLAGPEPVSHHHGHAAGTDPAGVGAHAVGWLAMVAVMAPLIAVNVRYVALRSPRHARVGVTGDVVAGWAAVWAAAGIVLAGGAWLVAGAVGDLVAIGLLTVFAVAWQHAGLKRRSQARCHRLLAPPLDRRRSRRTCRRYGVVLGRDCVLSCWPLMGLMAVAGHNPLVVASTVGVVWYERRRRPHHDPATTGTSLAIAAIGATALVAASLG